LRVKSKKDAGFKRRDSSGRRKVDEQHSLSEVVARDQTRCLRAIPFHFHFAANDDEKVRLALSLGCYKGSARIMHGEEEAGQTAPIRLRQP
jgi:hypothetical protein